MANTGARATHSGSQIARQRNMIVLDEHGVIQTKAVVAATAHTHRIFLQRAQAGHGLARAGHARAERLDGLGNRMCGCGYTAEVTEVVESRALGREHRAAFAADASDFRARLEQSAIAAAGFELHLPIHERERQSRQIQPRQHAVLTRHQAQLILRIYGHDGIRGQVTGAAQVFQQGHAHQRLQHHIGQGRNRQGSNFINAHLEYLYSVKNAMLVSGIAW